jgi:hypothetical protein
MWETRRLTTLWAFTVCYGIALPFFFTFSQSMSNVTSAFGFSSVVLRSCSSGSTYVELVIFRANVPHSHRRRRPKCKPKQQTTFNIRHGGTLRNPKLHSVNEVEMCGELDTPVV